MNLKYEKIKQKLSEKDFKFTNQRKAVYDVFYNNRNRYLSANEVYEKVRKKHKTGLTTIYRTIELLKDLNLLKEMPIAGEETYYILIPKKHKHHIVCTKCKKVEEIDECMMEDMGEKISDESGFKITGHELIIYGICKKCIEKYNL